MAAEARTRRRIRLAALTCLTLVALAPGGVAEARSPFNGLAIRARTQHGSFSGRFSIHSFSQLGKQVLAIGSLTGRMRDSRYPGPQSVREPAFRIPVRLRSGGGCSKLQISLPGRARVFGLYGTLNRVTIRVSGSPGSRRGKLICTINHEARAHQLQPLVQSLNTLRAGG